MFGTVRDSDSFRDMRIGMFRSNFDSEWDWRGWVLLIFVWDVWLFRGSEIWGDDIDKYHIGI